MCFFIVIRVLHTYSYLNEKTTCSKEMLEGVAHKLKNVKNINNKMF